MRRLVVLEGDPADDPCWHVYHGDLARWEGEPCVSRRSLHERGDWTHEYVGPRVITAEDAERAWWKATQAETAENAAALFLAALLEAEAAS